MDETRDFFRQPSFDRPDHGKRENIIVFPFEPLDDEDEPACELFEICEELSNLYIEYRQQGENSYSARLSVEETIMDELELPPDRGAALLDLSLETLHLRMYGKYRRTEPEIGWLISFVTGGWTGAGEN